MLVTYRQVKMTRNRRIVDLNRFLNLLTAEQWAAIEAASTAVTALVAILAALFAFVQVRQARHLRLEQARPFVVVDFESSPVWQNAIELVIQNIGHTIATDVVVSFNPPLESSKKHEGYDLAKSALLKEGIPAMPPGKRVTAIFDLSHERKDSGLPMSYLATVTFSDYRGKQQEPLQYRLDLNFRYGLRRFTEYGLHDAAKSLQEIEKLAKKWTEHFNGLRVYVVDEDARKFEDRWQEQRGGDSPSLARPIPAGRRAPSRFDRYVEPLWKRCYWAGRILITSPHRRRTLRNVMTSRPDLADFYASELQELSGLRLMRLAWSQLRK